MPLILGAVGSTCRCRLTRQSPETPWATVARDTVPGLSKRLLMPTIETPPPSPPTSLGAVGQHLLMPPSSLKARYVARRSSSTLSSNRICAREFTCALRDPPRTLSAPLTQLLVRLESPPQLSLVVQHYTQHFR